MTAKVKAAAQLQALLKLRAQRGPDASLDHMIRNIQVRYGWLKCTTVQVNRPARKVQKVYHVARHEVPALRR